MPHDFLKMVASNGWFGYVMILVISCWGGTVRYITAVKAGLKPSWLTWFYEVFTSAFVGVITGLLCIHYNVDETLTLAITGISAHIGTQSLTFIKKLILKNFRP